MKEQEAIERIKRVLIYRVGQGGTDELDHATIADCAALAWDEIKAIAREDTLAPPDEHGVRKPWASYSVD